MVMRSNDSKLLETLYGFTQRFKDSNRHKEAINYQRILICANTNLKVKLLAACMLPEIIMFVHGLSIDDLICIHLGLLREEEELEIRILAIKGLPLFCKYKPECLSGIVHVLVQLLPVEESAERNAVHKAIMSLLRHDAKASLTALLKYVGGHHKPSTDATIRSNGIPFMRDQEDIDYEGLIMSDKTDVAVKILAAQILPKLLRFFPGFSINSLMKAHVDLLKEEELEIRVHAIVELPLFYEVFPGCVSCVVFVLVRFLAADEFAERDAARKAIVSLLRLNAEASMTALFNYIESADKPSTDARIRLKVIRFIRDQILPLKAEVLKCQEMERNTSIDVEEEDLASELRWEWNGHWLCGCGGGCVGFFESLENKIKRYYYGYKVILVIENCKLGL